MHASWADERNGNIGPDQWRQSDVNAEIVKTLSPRYRKSITRPRVSLSKIRIPCLRSLPERIHHAARFCYGATENSGCDVIIAVIDTPIGLPLS